CAAAHRAVVPGFWVLVRTGIGGEQEYKSTAGRFVWVGSRPKRKRGMHTLRQKESCTMDARSSVTITVRLSVAWWLRWYLSGVALMCKMTRCQPDMGKVQYWVSRSIKRG